MKVAFLSLAKPSALCVPSASNFERRDREFQVIDWTGRRCEVKHVVDLLFRNKDEVRDVVFDEPEILVPGEMADVRRVTGDEIVDGDDTMTFCQKPIRQMRAEKARTSSHDRNRVGIFRHRGVFLIAAGQLYQHERSQIVDCRSQIAGFCDDSLSIENLKS